MGRKLEWELSGKSDVPQKMAQAKASMEGLDGAANALSKKFKEAFKDIALGFVAPMVLVQKAIGFIADQFAKVQQFAQESKEFAKDAESGKYFRTGGREALIQAQEREDERIKKLKGQVGSFMGYAAFLENDPRGAEILRRSSLSSAGVGTAGQVSPIPGVSTLISIFSTLTARRAAAASMATDPKVRSEIDAILAGDVAKRAAAEASAAADKNAPTAQKIAEVSGNVIGVGQSPQLDAMRQQIVLQEDMANSLRQLVEADQAKQGFRPERGFDLGGMGSSGRTVFPR
jgi:hypothetical protein